MPLGTLDRAPPPFFRQGASALSKLMLFSAVALFLMVADTRFQLTGPVRMTIASVLYPVQWALLQPVTWTRDGFRQVQSLRSAQDDATTLREQLRLQAPRVQQFDQLSQENERLRQLLELRARMPTPGLAAQVLYDAADPYAHKVIIDKGLIHGVSAGAPVLDESGVLGQVTRVYPSLSEVTLVIDADQAIPVLNIRTGVRAVAFGDPSLHGGALELRYMGSNADVQPGDILTTSGIDGVFPPGLPVARVEKVERRVELPFALIYCVPQARVAGASQVLVLPTLAGQQPPRPQDKVVIAPKPGKKDGGKGVQK
ncbi:rod shape-determining protein MreC [Curvibacter sp. PAE-UM]|uniref:rod shape-determining protein MreC n=1 Tax=Curvibacter sp. PAE-UM TaxID=1714344 RepID=UPI000708BC1B|nr:rod shape-determining protein MreC [Curvibacter sp. PAE-UM]KRH99454.1 rod shape-determining protein MreC [Curvibacter sp. PAE-UM]